MISPYYQDDHVTIYHGDCRDIMPQIGAIETIITDPVWPDCPKDLEYYDGDPYQLFEEAVYSFPKPQRVSIALSIYSDPLFLAPIRKIGLEFIRCIYLRYRIPHYKGKILVGGDIAYCYGELPDFNGHWVLGGEHTSKASKQERKHHPTPRRIEHMEFLVRFFSENEILDPFAGGGTTLEAAYHQKKKAIGIEKKEKYCEAAAKRIEKIQKETLL